MRKKRFGVFQAFFLMKTAAATEDRGGGRMQDFTLVGGIEAKI